MNTAHPSAGRPSEGQDSEWLRWLESERERRSFSYLGQKVSVTPEEITIDTSDGEERYDRDECTIDIHKVTQAAGYLIAALIYGGLIFLVSGMLTLDPGQVPSGEPTGLRLISIHPLPYASLSHLAEKFENLGLEIVRLETGQIELTEYRCPLCGHEEMSSNTAICPGCHQPMQPTGRVENTPTYRHFLKAGTGLQAGIIVTAVTLLLQPVLISLVVHPLAAAGVSALLHLSLYSTGLLALPAIVFIKLEKIYGRGWTPLFFSALAISLIAIPRVLSMTMRTYSMTLKQGDRRTELYWANPEGGALADVLRRRSAPESRIRRTISGYLSIGKLAGSRQKRCHYCRSKTMTECIRCHKPICPTHTAKLKGYKVCLECFVQRRGKHRKPLR